MIKLQKFPENKRFDINDLSENLIVQEYIESDLSTAIIHPEYQYLNLLEDVLHNGIEKKVFYTKESLDMYNSQGVTPPSIKSVTGRILRFDLSQGFPLLTTKKVFWKGIVHELLWYLRGETNIKYLVDNNVNIWNIWAYKAYCKLNQNEKSTLLSEKDFVQRLRSESKNSKFVKLFGDLKSTYGNQWRSWDAGGGRRIDQLNWVIENLKKRPYRKSYVVSAWNPAYIYEMALPKNVSESPPACTTIFQLVVSEEDKLNLVLFQRSGDLFLGVPFDIASYALLLQLIAHVTKLQVGEFIHFISDAHIYSNHIEQVQEQLRRIPYTMPIVTLNQKITSIDEFDAPDISLCNYKYHEAIRASVANVGGY